MNCQHATLLIGADPYGSSPELTEHLQSCTHCADLHREMLGLEANIRRALEDPPAVAPEPKVNASVANIRDAHPASRRVRGVHWRGWALAASLVVAIVGAVWVLRPSDTLAHDVVAHVQSEPDSWRSTHVVDAHAVEGLLRKAGVSDSNLLSQEVTYAQFCFFRGHFVPHLVLHTTQGPVTVMVLPDEHVSRRETFNESGFAGVIVPAPHGSLAVLSRGATTMAGVAQSTWFTVGQHAQP